LPCSLLWDCVQEIFFPVAEKLRTRLSGEEKRGGKKKKKEREKSLAMQSLTVVSIMPFLDCSTCPHQYKVFNAALVQSSSIHSAMCVGAPRYRRASVQVFSNLPPECHECTRDPSTYSAQEAYLAADVSSHESAPDCGDEIAQSSASRGPYQGEVDGCQTQLVPVGSKYERLQCGKGAKRDLEEDGAIV
jgi:hypothetical protein